MGDVDNKPSRPGQFANEPLENQLGSFGRQEVMVSNRGVSITTFIWPPSSDPKGVIQVLHGNGSYLFNDYLARSVS
jgi:hypothetical protein